MVPREPLYRRKRVSARRTSWSPGTRETRCRRHEATMLASTSSGDDGLVLSEQIYDITNTIALCLLTFLVKKLEPGFRTK